MLFHVTATHTTENCPIYQPRDKAVEFLNAGDKIPQIARERKVTVHFFVSAAPEHVFWALLEADSLAAVQSLLAGIPLRQDFRITPVQHLQDTLDVAKAMLSQH
ncbi:MAG: hypothetical protein HY686_08315 [Chloroflexi bacterium]|nr:hypothetical protein [Chloroflexota bacterium]